ncbi:MAG: hypothetical protein FWG73_06625 [Planctomycetaceae bacterium]|nr:hypothetical protein [Planctomycetaceae bacterium]
MTRKKMTKVEARAYHEQVALDQFAAYELTDSDDFENRQKARNILRYQTRGYCFELPPTCSKYGTFCSFCSHLKCRDNEQYDRIAHNDDFDPDIDRYVDLFDYLKTVANTHAGDVSVEKNTTFQMDTKQSLHSLLTLIANAKI